MMVMGDVSQNRTWRLTPTHVVTSRLVCANGPGKRGIFGSAVCHARHTGWAIVE